MRVSGAVADFYQSGSITTLHRLGTVDLGRLEDQLLGYTSARPVALVLPCLYAELRHGRVQPIAAALQAVPYLENVVISLDGADDPSQVEEVRQLFAGVPTRDPRGPTVLWNDSPKTRDLLAEMRKEGLDPGGAGKGRALWLAFGMVLALGRSRVIAVHDCDIRDYQRDLLARLCFPAVHPHQHFEFAKGYYSRVADRLYGRVTRLYVAPLLRALSSVLGPLPFLDYLADYRYPLSGEYAMTVDLARSSRIPADWGLEVGLLAEVYRNCAHKRICQVELVENYDHKHRALSPEDPSRGLHRMAIDIGVTLIRNLASFGVALGGGEERAIGAAYLRRAQDAIARYHADAELNGIPFDRHDEERAVETFAAAWVSAVDRVRQRPLAHAEIPNWSRVCAARPDLLDDLLDAAESGGSSKRFVAISGGMA